MPDWSIGAANFSKKTISSYYKCYNFIDSTLPHEMGHFIFKEYIKGANVPLCIHEGIAQLLENTERRYQYNSIIGYARNKKKYIPLSELIEITFSKLSQMEDIDVTIFYAESIWLIEYLYNKHGKFDFSSFLRCFKEGRSINSALKWAFGYDNISKLEQ